MRISKNEIMLLTYFRNNARKPLTRISRETHIPVSTIFDKLKAYEKELIKKYTTLIDFKKVGFDIHALMLFKVDKASKQSFQEFIMRHHRVNNVFRVNNDYDFVVEAVFKDMADYQDFIDRTDSFDVHERKDFFIVREITRESFLSRPEHIELLFPDISKKQKTIRI